MANRILVISTFIAISFSMVASFEPSPLQDFCVADPTSSGQDCTDIHRIIRFSWHAARVNGLACLDSKMVQANHFSFSGLHIPGNTSNALEKGDVFVFPIGLVLDLFPEQPEHRCSSRC
ncbi:hypothetical protein D5086_003906 [Populus alba]|uniref:Uncharacterized protein n=2 Tax=Populus alba TaxID=43335 RepID=A0ACC4D5M0_POPAL|nr:hypothetical protein D5086_0000225130 [Populus alba]